MTPLRLPPRLLIAASASGEGKTTLTLALLAAFAARGLRAASGKCGPDFVDPLFHRTVLGVQTCNMDFFLAPPEAASELFRRTAADADVAVIEGAMGLYDGVGGTEEASAWHVAAETETPVVLAVRPKGAFLTLAAVVGGLKNFRGGGHVRGIVLNRCAAAFAEKLAPVLEKETGLRVYGHLPEIPEASFGERHLGLIPPGEAPALRTKVDALAKAAERTLDIAGLLALARTASPHAGAAAESVSGMRGGFVSAPRIAVAKDAAFCLYYEENLRLLRSFGAELVFFSPLADGALPAGTRALYLGGGYPELHAGALAANAGLRDAIRTALAGGLPCLAESGGFLYLQTALEDREGRAHPMVGFLPGTGRNAGRLVRFGYQVLRARTDNLLCRAGETMPAHEFHYWTSGNSGADCIAAKPDGGGEWDSVVATPSLFAGFPHLYFLGRPDFARNFVAAAAGGKTA